ncbi:Ig family protein [Thioploca ingrica]|uniref:Ig family protein n=1 Tax=Thioploca ingrica TaxID=40754 RepID=A0A090AJU0_9GAMM|nr:Ig family protein [Thioploca ingrica]
MNKNISIPLVLTFYLLLPSFLLTLSLPALAGMSFVERLQNGQGQVEGLDGASLVAVSHDGKFVYVASSEDNLLTVLIRNSATGEVTPTHSVSVSDARSLTVSADDQFIYSVGSEGLTVFKRDPNTGQLSLQQTIPGEKLESNIISVTVSADNQSVYVLSWVSLAVFKRDPSSEQLTFKQILRNGQDGVEGLGDTRSVTVSSDNQFVYVLGGDTLAVFKRDPITEQLTFQQILKNGQDGVEGIENAHSVTVSPDNQFIYMLDWDTLAVFKHDLSTEQLTFKQILKNGQDGVEGLGDARSIAVSADNQFVYVASYGDNAVAVFACDLSTGQLTLQQVLKNGETGVKGLEGANSVSASVDNQWVYVASILSNAVAVLARNPSTGQLTLRQVLKDGQTQVDGLDGVRSVAVSADDQFVYVASGADDAVVAFARDKNTGQLTLRQVLRDGQAGVDGLVGARSITVSADDQFVYVISNGDKALAVFARDKNTGQLSFQQVLKDGQNGVEGLAKARSITASADNLSVYVTP